MTTIKFTYIGGHSERIELDESLDIKDIKTLIKPKGFVEFKTGSWINMINVVKIDVIGMKNDDT